MAKEENRRKHQREKYSFKAFLYDFKGAEAFECVTDDVSEGGARILINRDLKKEGLIYLHIHFKEGDPMISKGRVAWVRQSEEADKGAFEAGIEFQEIDESDQLVIKSLVETAIEKRKQESPLG